MDQQTLQLIFDRVCKRILDQGHGCFLTSAKDYYAEPYMGNANEGCALGLLVPPKDRAAMPNMMIDENVRVLEAINKHNPDFNIEKDSDHEALGLLASLQTAHDNACEDAYCPDIEALDRNSDFIKEFKAHAKQVATNFALNTKVLQ